MGANYHICLFDDDPFIAGLYARKFEERGWETSVADRQEEVWKCLDNGATLLLIDIALDGGAAEQIVRELRTGTSKFKHIPIVILTEISDRSTVQEMMKLGVDAYLFKGHFVPSEAVEKVQRILDARVV